MRAMHLNINSACQTLACLQAAGFLFVVGVTGIHLSLPCTPRKTSDNEKIIAADTSSISTYYSVLGIFYAVKLIMLKGFKMGILFLLQMNLQVI